MDIYTLQKGLMSCIVSGVRKAKSRQANVFQAINIVDFSVLESESRLSRITEAQLAYTYDAVNSNVIISSVAMFFIDLARNSIKENESNPELYQFLKSSLIKLDDDTDNIKLRPHFFALELSTHLGFAPRMNWSEDNKYFDLVEGEFIDNDVRHNCILDADTSLDLMKLINNQGVQEITKSGRSQLLDKLILYYSLHLDGFKELKCIKVLRSVLS